MGSKFHSDKEENGNHTDDVSDDGEVLDEDDGAFDINRTVNDLFEDAPDSEEGALDHSEDEISQRYLEKITPRKEGPSVGQILDVIIEARFGAGAMSSEEARFAGEKMRRPQNCPSLKTPTINKEVRDSMDAYQK